VKITRTHTRNAASEAIFGSASRGTADRLSDRDILIIDDDVELLRVRANELKNQGWSVASYTFAKLEALAAKGALFIQHLKLEASISRDDGGRLLTLLREFEPRTDYSSELRLNRQLADLCRVVADNPRGALFAADVLFVSLRNWGVLWLAQQRRYVFSYEEILQGLRGHRMIDASSIGTLTKLRFLKCLYRSGEKDCSGRAFDAVGDALRYLPREHFPSVATIGAPDAILEAAAPFSNASAYVILRDVERRFLAAEPLLRSGLLNEEFSTLRRWIQNPRAYASLAATLAPGLRLELRHRIESLTERIQPRHLLAPRL
jgi:hypothetical protein